MSGCGVAGRVLAGDSWDVLPGLPDGSVDVVLTDPPYGLTSKRRRFLGRERKDRGRDHLRGFGGQFWDVDSPVEDPAFWRIVARLLSSEAVVASFSAPRTWHRQAAAMIEAGLVIQGVWGWSTGNTYPASLNMTVEAGRVPAGVRPVWWDAVDWSGFGTALKSVWEPVIVASLPSGADRVAGLVERAGHGVFYVPKIQPVEQFTLDGLKHPTMKPGVLLDRLLDALDVAPGDRLLDPFLGSGSSGLAAFRRGCPWVGVELCDGSGGRPDYVGLVLERCAAEGVPAGLGGVD
jgi:hypothetical protein